MGLVGDRTELTGINPSCLLSPSRVPKLANRHNFLSRMIKPSTTCPVGTSHVRDHYVLRINIRLLIYTRAFPPAYLDPLLVHDVRDLLAIPS